ncbi:MAG: antibiotic biosynthesis monooxygenase [Thermodesulfobacteriota bacterium]|nr:antibiotic biosynthesis monooxygenase [Thermodesulfobacteriota bacterium]
MFANYYKLAIPKEYLNKAIAQMCKIQNNLINNAEGCVKYQFTQDLENENLVYLFAMWETKENYDKNFESRYGEIEIFDKLVKYEVAIISTEQLIISEHKIVT